MVQCVLGSSSLEVISQFKGFGSQFCILVICRLLNVPAATFRTDMPMWKHHVRSCMEFWELSNNYPAVLACNAGSTQSPGGVFCLICVVLCRGSPTVCSWDNLEQGSPSVDCRCFDGLPQLSFMKPGLWCGLFYNWFFITWQIFTTTQARAFFYRSVFSAIN